MLSKYDVIRYFQKEEVVEMGYKLSEDKQFVLKVETGEIAFSVDYYLQEMRKELHCDFECIFSEHASLTTIYRCKECGTVIFGGDDEDRYDPLLKCPTCGGYETGLKYWTQAEIDSDPEKQEALRAYESFMLEMEAQAKRKEKRGLNDWEIWKKIFPINNGQIELSLECNNLFHTGLKGLHLEVTKWTEKSKGCLTWDYDWYIPLSFFAIKTLIYKRKMLKEIKAKREAEAKQV